jgi:hypothetical protein
LGRTKTAGKPCGFMLGTILLSRFISMTYDYLRFILVHLVAMID